MAKMYPSVVQDFHNSQGEKLVYEALITLNKIPQCFVLFAGWGQTSSIAEVILKKNICIIFDGGMTKGLPHNMLSSGG